MIFSSASTLFFLFFFSVWKGGNHRKITIIIEDPVAGLQCRGTASCPSLHICYSCMICCCRFLFCFSFFLQLLASFVKLLHNIPVMCHSIFSYFYLVKCYPVVPGKFLILHFSQFPFLFFGHCVISYKPSNTTCCADLNFHQCLSWIRSYTRKTHLLSSLS